MNKQNSVVSVKSVSHHYDEVVALKELSLEIPSGTVVGLVGPDGVGKSTLLSLITGAREIQTGEITVLGGDMREKKSQNLIGAKIAYMPQGLGKNLYHTLSVEENLQFFGRLYGHDRKERRQRIDHLTKSTGLYPFLDRPAGKLSGGMKQKLGLCCALINDPALLVLDEPTTGVDPLARAQFWQLIEQIQTEREGMSVIVATAYMDEAERFDWTVVMNGGEILATGSPAELLQETNSQTLEEAFIELLPAEQKKGHRAVKVTPLEISEETEVAIAAKGLTKQFGQFTAVNNVNFDIYKGEIFGFLGSNGCGKTTTMKMLTGLLEATAGQAWIFGQEVDPEDLNTKRRVGYMSQSFSLYTELTIYQNLILHAKLFGVPKEEREARVNEMVERFSLRDVLHALPDNIPLGMRQRLSLAVALVHKPEILILDEPTSGVDPVARDNFWHYLIDLSRRDKVTIFITTHFMNEAARCDRMSMMHAGEVLDSDVPQNLVAKQGTNTLEEAFIKYLIEAGADEAEEVPDTSSSMDSPPINSSLTNSPLADSPMAVKEKGQKESQNLGVSKYREFFSLQRLLSYTWREGLELRRDPIRLTLALFGSLILMVTMGFGITMDVEDLNFAVLDRDQSMVSQNYINNIAGSRYFIEKPPLHDYEELDRRLKNTDITLAIEIPPNFARDIARNTPVEIMIWVDGAMPSRAETIKGYIQGMHQNWLSQQAQYKLGASMMPQFNLETRFRYNPDVKSLPAIVPAVIPILLLMIPAMLAALSVVREKELGSILNLYVTPVTRAEFLLGKQIPYILLALVNFLLMVILSVYLFQVPIKGDFFTLLLGAFIFSIISTGMGLLCSTFTKSQIAAMFFTMIITMLPAVSFSGLLNPISSLEGVGRMIGEIYPASHMFLISRGIFSKNLGFFDLTGPLFNLLIAIPIILTISILLLRKQDK